MTCKRKFFEDAELDEVSCRKCGDEADLRYVCMACQKPTTSIDHKTWRCPQCVEAHEVALHAAGAGETPSGPLRDKAGRARRVRADG